MTYKKKLIEVALPLASMNAASYREQTIKRGKPTQMHKWFAARPLTTARAVIWASLVDDPSSDTSLSVEEQDRERERLFKILEQLVVWENSNDPTVLSAAKAEIDRCFPDGPPPVLDPFGGGGAIPLEAQRLGLTALSGDLNPVAVLIQKAMIEIPPRFANQPPVHPDLRNELNTWTGAQGLAADVEAYGQWMRDEAEKQIGHLYPNVISDIGEEVTPIAWIWARTVKSPDPTWNGHVPLVSTWLLSKKDGKPTAWIEPDVDRSNQSISYRIRTHGVADLSGTIRRGNGICIATGATISSEYIKSEAKAGRLGTVLTAIVAKSPSRSGRIFIESDGRTEEPIEKKPDWFPSCPMSDHSQYMGPPRYGFDEWWKLFTPRQIDSVRAFIVALEKVRGKVAADSYDHFGTDTTPLRSGGHGAHAYAEAVSLYLAFAIDRLADWNNSMCGWDSSNSVNQQLFRRQAIPMMWDFCEIRPFDNAAGSFEPSVSTIATAIRELPHASKSGSVTQRECVSSVALFPKAVVSTDPPYYDAVPYADISDFFYPLLRASIGHSWPDETSTIATPKAEELVADSRRHGSRKGAAEFFESGMQKLMTAIQENHNPDVPSTIYYAFKNTETRGGVTETGWSTFLQAAIDSELTISATWPVRTENPSRMRALNSNVLASTIVLACRPREIAAPLATRGEFIATLRSELPEAVRVLQTGNIAPVDVAQSTIGPGIAVFSRYAKVVEADGSTMTVAVALSLINDVLGEILDGEESEMDNDSRFALAWYSQHAYNPAASGDAINLAQAKNTSLDGLVDAGIAHTQGGRFRLLERDEMLEGWDPAADNRMTVWEATQYLVAALDRSETEAGELLHRLGSYGERARQLAYLLFKKATDNGWADEAGAYNNLVTAWPNLQTTTTSSTAPTQSELDL